jgi:hypothetical protein
MVDLREAFIPSRLRLDAGVNFTVSTLRTSQSARGHQLLWNTRYASSLATKVAMKLLLTFWIDDDPSSSITALASDKFDYPLARTNSLHPHIDLPPRASSSPIRRHQRDFVRRDEPPPDLPHKSESTSVQEVLDSLKWKFETPQLWIGPRSYFQMSECRHNFVTANTTDMPQNMLDRGAINIRKTYNDDKSYTCTYHLPASIVDDVVSGVRTCFPAGGENVPGPYDDSPRWTEDMWRFYGVVCDGNIPWSIKSKCSIVRAKICVENSTTEPVEAPAPQ